MQTNMKKKLECYLTSEYTFILTTYFCSVVKITPLHVSVHYAGTSLHYKKLIKQQQHDCNLLVPKRRGKITIVNTLIH